MVAYGPLEAMDKREGTLGEGRQTALCCPDLGQSRLEVKLKWNLKIGLGEMNPLSMWMDLGLPRGQMRLGFLLQPGVGR